MAIIRNKRIVEKSLTLDSSILNEVIHRIVVCWDSDVITSIQFNESPLAREVALMISRYFDLNESMVRTQFAQFRAIFLDDRFHLQNETINLITNNIILEN